MFLISVIGGMRHCDSKKARGPLLQKDIIRLYHSLQKHQHIAHMGGHSEMILGVCGSPVQPLPRKGPNSQNYETLLAKSTPKVISHCMFSLFNIDQFKVDQF